MSCLRPDERIKHLYYANHRWDVNSIIRSQAGVVILGDSIVHGFGRYPEVVDRYLKSLNAIYCGYKGDKIQHILWRVDNLSLPDSVHTVVLLVGTNNMEYDTSENIATGIMLSASKLREKHPQLRVVVTGILPRDLFPTTLREKVRQTNVLLESHCSKMSNVFFVKESPSWTKECGRLDEVLYFKDHLHLVQPGYNILAGQLETLIKSMPERITRMTQKYPFCRQRRSPSPKDTCSYRLPATVQSPPSSVNTIPHRPCHRPRIHPSCRTRPFRVQTSHRSHHNHSLTSPILPSSSAGSASSTSIPALPCRTPPSFNPSPPKRPSCRPSRRMRMLLHMRRHPSTPVLSAGCSLISTSSSASALSSYDSFSAGYGGCAIMFVLLFLCLVFCINNCVIVDDNCDVNIYEKGYINFTYFRANFSQTWNGSWSFSGFQGVRHILQPNQINSSFLKALMVTVAGFFNLVMQSIRSKFPQPKTKVTKINKYNLRRKCFVFFLSMFLCFIEWEYKYNPEYHCSKKVSTEIFDLKFLTSDKRIKIYYMCDHMRNEALSKLEMKNNSYILKLLLLLSGDIETNPGPGHLPYNSKNKIDLTGNKSKVMTPKFDYKILKDWINEKSNKGVETLSNKIVCNAIGIGLNVKSDVTTEGDGNCFYRAIIQQIQRPEIRCQIYPEFLNLNGHLDLRNRVVWLIKNQQNSVNYIKQFKILYLTAFAEEHNYLIWDQFLDKQHENADFATTLFIAATAVLLGVDIHMTSNTSTRERPWLVISRFWTNEENHPPSTHPIIIGGISLEHFQSLLPSTVSNNDIDFRINRPSYSGVVSGTSSSKYSMAQSLIDSPRKQPCVKLITQKDDHRKVMRKKKDENDLKWKCNAAHVEYHSPSKDETSDQQKKRRLAIRRKIKIANNKVKKENELKALCDISHVAYTSPMKGEINVKGRNRRYTIKQNIKTANEYNTDDLQVVQEVINNLCDTVVSNNIKDGQQDLMNLHPNPKVIEAISNFEKGEMLHTVATCSICLESRPVFHATKPIAKTVPKPVAVSPWKLTKEGICQRCHKDKVLRRKKGNHQAAKFSGCFSHVDDMGPPENKIRTNQMHFEHIPPYLQNLTTVEMALISRISVVMNVHILRYGMLASKGHCISLPQENKIAKSLPLLSNEIGIIILKRRGLNQILRQYTVKRTVVEQALKGLCFGFPNGGSITPQDGYHQYSGPNQSAMVLKGRYFQFFPNPYYKDVVIEENRLSSLPEIREELPGLNVINLPNIRAEEDKGPAPLQAELEHDKDDESVTRSFVTTILEPRQAQKNLDMILENLIGKEEAAKHGKAISVNWEYNKGKPVNELKTPGFFTMAFPTIFINGSCDYTGPKLNNFDFDNWVKHIYYTGDGRVPRHPHLKFLLLNLRLRQMALKQGSYLVAQQLADAHLSISELKKNLNDEDDSVPRKIISVGGNLPNSSPYWRDKKRDLDAVTYFRLKEYGDMPAYFDTMSCAEYHCVPLLELLIKYYAVVNKENEDVIRNKVNNDSKFKRTLVLENLHIVTNYFDTRCINYYASVMKETLQISDVWWRYEFAKSRGEIHSHAIVCSEKHASKIKLALQGDDPAGNLYKFLQTADLNDKTDEIYSPGFYSLHPAGGKVKYTTSGERKWISNKSKWPLPEGTQPPPRTNPLTKSLTSSFENVSIDEHYIYMVNRLARHICGGSYCLKTKRKSSSSKENVEKIKYCRFHFGDRDPVTKKTSGKTLHPFEPRIYSGAHPRYEGPLDHPRMIAHIRVKLLSWKANCDTQPIIDTNLLALQKYISGYACKGGCTTEDLIHVYRHLIENVSEDTGVKTLATKLLMKIIGCVDVSAACADFMNTGGKLYHCTRKVRRVGLSGFRMLNESGRGGKATCSTPLDKFLSEERRTEYPDITLWNWAKKCNCYSNDLCGSDHAPLFTGLATYPTWPVSEEYAKGQLMIHSPGTWKNTDDLKGHHDNFVSALADFMESEYCPNALKIVLQEAHKDYEKKTKIFHRNNNNSQHTQSSENEFDSQTTTSQCSQNVNHIGAAMLRDQAQVHSDEINDPIRSVPLFDGGPDFNWSEYGIKCLGMPIPNNVNSWFTDACQDAKRNEKLSGNEFDLPNINLLLANPLQRVVIVINLIRLLAIKKGELPADIEPLRLLIQGTAGVGKTFVITAITYIVRRLFGRNGAVMNLAPTGASSVLIPNGRTYHSITTIPRNKKQSKFVQLSDYPMKMDALTKLRDITGMIDEKDIPLKLITLNLDERSMYSKTNLAWCSQRFNEATGGTKSFFGGIPIVNFFGDLGQLGPIKCKDLHVAPNNSEAIAKLAGYVIYKSFEKCVLLSQTMRQGKDQETLLNRLLRIRSGTITQNDWIEINDRYEEDLPDDEKKSFSHNKVITLMETWAEVNDENHIKLGQLGVPVAVIPSIGKGYHSKTEKQCGQIVQRAKIAVGSPVMLTKNQNELTCFGLNNGAVGTVISIIYDKDTAPPSFPVAVVVDFPEYKGPAWIQEKPKWVPIPVVNESRCDTNCCSRTGIPLMPGFAIPIAKSQGMTIGHNKVFTHCRVKLQAITKMEELNLGTTYTALSRVERESNWTLVETIPEKRLTYINGHPHMTARREEEQRLQSLSDATVAEYQMYANVEGYVALLRQLDECCNDSIINSRCQNPNANCSCILCNLN